MEMVKNKKRDEKKRMEEINWKIKKNEQKLGSKNKKQTKEWKNENRLKKE